MPNDKIKASEIQGVKVEPTASFAVDIKFEHKMPPLMNTHFTALFRPFKKWKGEDFGFDWVRIGDSGLFNDNDPKKDHLVKKIGKYYQKGTYKLNAGTVTGSSSINFNRIIEKDIRRSGSFTIEATHKFGNNPKDWVFLKGTGHAFYIESELYPTNTSILNQPRAPLLSQKPILVNINANATVEGDIYGTFEGIDDGNSNNNIPHVNIHSKIAENKIVKSSSEIDYRKKFNFNFSSINNIGYYGNDPNDYRYMYTDNKKERIRSNPNYITSNVDFVAMPELYKKMMRKNFPVSFTVLWKLRELSNKTKPTDPTEYEIYKSEFTYSVPILFIRKGNKAKLKIITERDKTLSAKPIRIDFREKTVTENNFSISSLTGDKGGDIEITCNNDFTDFKYIDAYAIYDKPNSPKNSGGIEIHCGQIRVHPNKIMRQLNVVFVSVGKNGRGPTLPNNKSEEVLFAKNIFENQAMLDIQIMSEELPISEMPNKDVHTVFCQEFSSKFGNKYNNYIKAFFLKTKGTCNTDYNQRSIVLHEGRLYETFAHEMGHALGLPHTFTCKEIADRTSPKYRTGKLKDPSANAEITYQGRMTDNIMDYSHVSNENFEAESDEVGSKTGRRFALYYWQIRKIWEEVDAINNANNPIPIESSNEEITNLPFNIYKLYSDIKI